MSIFLNSIYHLDTAPDGDGEGDEDEEVGDKGDDARHTAVVLQTSSHLYSHFTPSNSTFHLRSAQCQKHLTCVILTSSESWAVP